jgi:hypothetical protein
MRTAKDPARDQPREFVLREARQEEYKQLGQLMVSVYSTLDGFPKQDEQPRYYEMLVNIGQLT